MTKEMKMKLF